MMGAYSKRSGENKERSELDFDIISEIKRKIEAAWRDPLRRRTANACSCEGAYEQAKAFDA